MRRVLIVNGGFYPAKNYGGPVVSIDNLCALISQDVECYIVCRNHDLGETVQLEGISKGWNLHKNCKVQYLSEKEINVNTIRNIVNEVRPDSIYLNSLFDHRFVLPILKIAKNNRIRVLLAPRGQMCKNAFTSKYKKLPYIFYLKTAAMLDEVYFQSTSDEETDSIKQYFGISDDRVIYLTNLPSIPHKELLYLRKEKSSAKLIFYSRIVPKKNLIYAIELISKIDSRIQLDIYGPLEDQSYWAQCQDKINRLPDNISAKYCGIIEHEDVFDVLSKYDAFFFPTKSENFGHVIAEALFAGCPVVISDQTPWRSLEKYGVGWDIALGDDSAYVAALNEIVKCNDDDIMRMRENAKKYADNYFNLDALKREYVNAIFG